MEYPVHGSGRGRQDPGDPEHLGYRGRQYRRKGDRRDATDEVAYHRVHGRGALHLVGADKLRLYGAPGQDRFDFMWDILLEQSKGVALILNHNNPDPLADLDHYLKALEERLLTRRLPLVIGITHTDLQPQRALTKYQDFLQQRGCKASDILPPIMEMDARNKKHVHAALVAMTAQLEMAERFPKIVAAGSRQ